MLKKGENMALTIKTNVSALQAMKTLQKTQLNLNSSIQKVSSGSRINKSADDISGLTVSSRLRTDNQSLKQAMKNTNLGISVIQTAEGSLNEVYNILTRMRELAVQASNDTYNSTDRSHMQIEFNQLRREISNISSHTNFNRIAILNSSDTMKFQIGIHNQSNNQFELALSTISATLGSLGISQASANITTLSTSQKSITTIDTALSSINDKRARLGAYQNRLESALNTASTYSQNLSATISSISDVDYATETAEMTKFQIMQQSGVAALSQAKSLPQSVLSLLS